MKKFTRKEQQSLLKLLEKHKDYFMSFEGVHYVDVGYKFKQGKRTDELVIRIHVHEKKPLSGLDPSQVLPQEIEGVTIDVIQSNPQPHQNRSSRFDPLVGGVQVSNIRFSGWGTLGAIVFDATSLAPMGLSNHHVFVGATGRVGDSITQPESNNNADIIGTLDRWDNNLDCAVCLLNDTRQITKEIIDYPKGMDNTREPTVGMHVTKSGATTETTFGIIDGISFEEFTIIPDPINPSPTGEISAPGDSGSVWLEVESCAGIGLHYAGETDPSPEVERAWAKQMIKVIDILNIEFISLPEFFVWCYTLL